jgi:hypothetical protein
MWLMVQIQPQNYAHDSNIWRANYDLIHMQHHYPQMEQRQEYYLQGDPQLHLEMVDYWQVDQAEDMDYVQDKLAVSNYRRIRALQAPTV